MKGTFFALLLAITITNTAVFSQTSENFDEVTVDGTGYNMGITNPRIFGNWSIGMTDISGAYADPANNFLDVTNLNFSQGGTALANGSTDKALHVFGFYGEAKTFVMKSTDTDPKHFAIQSFYIDGDYSSNLVAQGYSEGSKVVSQNFTTIGASAQQINLTDSKWKNIDEFRIEQQDGSADLAFFLDDITITAVPNNPPTDIQLSNSTVDENSIIYVAIGQFSASDIDVGQTFTYSLVPGTGDNDNSAFSIDVNTLRSGTTFDFERKAQYSIRVRVTDQSGAYFEKPFTITVNNLNEASYAINADNFTTPANAAYPLGLSFVDPDGQDQILSVTFTLTEGQFQTVPSGTISIGTAASTVSLTSTISNINDYIAGGGLSFVNDKAGSYAISVSITEVGQSVNNNSSASIEAIVTATLPVTLSEFKATAQKSGVQLDWQTGVQNSIRYFIVQRSPDGQYFADLGQLAVNSSADNLHYRYIDQTAPAGLNYYRLKLVASLSTTEADYSQIISIKSITSDWGLYPNPVTSLATIHSPTVLKKTATLYILNSAGRKVGSVTLQSGQKSWQISVANITSGLYYLQIRPKTNNISDTNQATIFLKMIKK